MVTDELIKLKTKERATQKTAGIYLIYCSENKKVYIGQSIRLLIRFQEHRTELKSKTHRNRYLQATYNKYGPKALSFHILEIIAGENEDILREKLTSREIYWLSLVDKEFRLNLSDITSPLKWSEEMRQEARLRVLNAPPERFKKISDTKKGVKFSEEHKQKLRGPKPNKKWSQERKQKFSLYQKEKYKTDQNHSLRYNNFHKLQKEDS